MNGKKAKSLRRALGFHPATPREYEHDKPSQKVAIGTDGKPQVYVVTGTIKTTGSRRSYQAVKRNPVLTDAVLRAA